MAVFDDETVFLLTLVECLFCLPALGNVHRKPANEWELVPAVDPEFIGLEIPQLAIFCCKVFNGLPESFPQSLLILFDHLFRRLLPGTVHGRIFRSIP